MWKGLVLGGLMLQLAACATPTRQSRELMRADLPPARKLESVPFVDQSEGHCGPAALTMAMKAAGSDADVGTIAPMVMTGGKGSLPTDMISAARRSGMMAVQIDNLTAAAREIGAGHPVIVFQNLAFGYLPQWHYALMTGYDIPGQKIILHSGHEAFKRENFRWFERTWSLADHWAIVVLKPGELARTANELEHLRAAAGLEQAGKAAEAERAYRSILGRWPESLGAFVGAANVAYAGGRYKEAVALLQKASALHPDSVVARHNLAVAESALK
jgi:hypothetical protein